MTTYRLLLEFKNSFHHHNILKHSFSDTALHLKYKVVTDKENL